VTVCVTSAPSVNDTRQVLDTHPRIGEERAKGQPGSPALDCPARQSHAWVAMEVETKFLRLFNPAALGDHIDGWRVCWGGRLGQMPNLVCHDGRETAPRPSVKSAPPSLRS
jgi:hypothetical protein